MLIADVELAEQHHQADADRPARRAVQGCAADLYGLLRTVAKHLGRSISPCSWLTGASG